MTALSPMSWDVKATSSFFMATPGAYVMSGVSTTVYPASVFPINASDVYSVRPTGAVWRHATIYAQHVEELLINSASTRSAG